MLPVNSGGHTAYQTFVLENLRKYYPDPTVFAKSTWDIIERFWNLDLSYTDELLRSKYSVFGPKPRTPSCMQRSYLLSIDFKVHSLTDWAAQLKINPLYAILSGFQFGDTPGVGTFYDFLDRLWDSDSDNLSPHIHPVKKKKVKKPKQKGDKAEPIEKVTVEQLFQSMEHSSFSIDEQPYASLFKIYDHEFLSVSISKGLIDISNLSIAGDGMPVTTSARERKHRICECSKMELLPVIVTVTFPSLTVTSVMILPENAFTMATTYIYWLRLNSESDLPLFPLFNPASKHDSHGFLEAYFRFKAFLPDFHVRKWLLDSAHDAMSYYLYCRKNDIQPFIDLNEKRGISMKYKDDFTIGKDGVPICKAGRKMNHDGSEPSKARLKFRCPLASRKYGCSCSTPCSDSKYGRTVHLAMKDNPRLINFPPRDSEQWKLEYNARTSAERSNKREKIDFQLESGRHRSTKMWYCRLYHILMLQHLDAWDLPFESTLAKLILNVA
ncbi:MAG: hypothetical protein ACLROG_12235 [Coprococcus phoceensis]